MDSANFGVMENGIIEYRLLEVREHECMEVWTYVFVEEWNDRIMDT
jgi:hypothetical protein